MTDLVKRKVDVKIGEGQYLDTAMLTEHSSPLIRNHFRRRYNINIPQVPARNVNPYHVLKMPMAVEIRIDDIIHVYGFKIGYVWDLSSTLRSMKCLLDNDDPRTLIASLPHDAAPRTKGMKFKEANRMYYWVARFFNLPVPLGILSWLGISSFVGRVKWRKNKKRREYLDGFFTYEKYKLTQRDGYKIRERIV